MKKSVGLLLIAIVSVTISGCIISKTPDSNDVTMNVGEPKIFSVKVFPPATYAWTLDGAPITCTERFCLYTALAGEHDLIVKASHVISTETQVWHIYGNSPPIANAGVDQSVNIDEAVTLDGSGSSDPDDNIVSYQWQQTDGPTVTLTNANTAIAQFTAPIEAGSVLTFDLTVTDSNGVQSTDTCMVTLFCASIVDLLNSMVIIPAGTFMMGSTEVSYAQPVHSVTLEGFDMSAFEVTQAQYVAVMGHNPSYFNGEGLPVDSVTWYEANQFCTTLSTLTGRTFTLPSEAQWEYACRADTTSRYCFGDLDADLENYGWYDDNSDDHPHEVGLKLPNPWGLYDMHGNVWEWCLDSMHWTYEGAPNDGSAWEPETDSDHVIRSGSWSSPASDSLSAHRDNFQPDQRYRALGFRIVEIP